MVRKRSSRHKDAEDTEEGQDLSFANHGQEWTIVSTFPTVVALVKISQVWFFLLRGEW
jgi:hypothetical protein